MITAKILKNRFCFKTFAEYIRGDISYDMAMETIKMQLKYKALKKTGELVNPISEYNIGGHKKMKIKGEWTYIDAVGKSKDNILEVLSKGMSVAKMERYINEFKDKDDKDDGKEKYPF